MNFLGIGPMELVLIVVLALIVLGPEKLPEVMSQVGRAVSELRKVTTQLNDEYNRAIQTELSETRAVVDETMSALGDARSTVDQALVSAGSAPNASRASATEAALGAPATEGGELHVEPAVQSASECPSETAEPAPNGVHAAPDETAAAEHDGGHWTPISQAPTAGSSVHGTSESDLLPPY